MNNTNVVIAYLIRNRNSKKWWIRLRVRFQTKILVVSSICKERWIRLRCVKTVRPRYEAEDILESLGRIADYL